jgi:Skp family chaperone for outer membrane proteins
VGSRNDAPGCGLTMMKVNENTSVKTLFPIVAMVLIGTTYATSAKSQPFIPDNRPRCSLAIIRGAQQAYDAYIDSIKRKHEQELWEKKKEMKNIRDRGESTVGIESGMKTQEILNEFELRRSSLEKLYEFENYAAKKYKCVLVILEYIP